MRVLACCLLILGALAVSDRDALPPAARCDSGNGEPVKAKPVSFAPRPGHRRVYGQPIQPPIFTTHRQPRKPSPPPQP
jgi:hypothetical protein